MPQIAKHPALDPITQFNVFVRHQGGLNEVFACLGAEGVHALAFCTVDTSDGAVLRLIVDDVESLRATLNRKKIAFNEVEVIGVEFQSCDHLNLIMKVLDQAEVNVQYVYPFLMRPAGYSGVVLSVNDGELAKTVLKKHQMKVLTQNDVTR